MGPLQTKLISAWRSPLIRAASGVILDWLKRMSCITPETISNALKAAAAPKAKVTPVDEEFFVTIGVSGVV